MVYQMTEDPINTEYFCPEDLSHSVRSNCSNCISFIK